MSDPSINIQNPLDQIALGLMQSTYNFNDPSLIPEGLEIVLSTESDQFNEAQREIFDSAGLQVAIYQTEADGQYFVGYRGTDPNSGADIENDLAINDGRPLPAQNALTL